MTWDVGGDSILQTWSNVRCLRSNMISSRNLLQRIPCTNMMYCFQNWVMMTGIMCCEIFWTISEHPMHLITTCWKTIRLKFWKSDWNKGLTLRRNGRWMQMKRWPLHQQWFTNLRGKQINELSPKVSDRWVHWASIWSDSSARMDWKCWRVRHWADTLQNSALSWKRSTWLKQR